MGTSHFILIKIRNIVYKKRIDLFLKQFCVYQFGHYDGYPSGKGISILSFLRKLVEENRWDEFVQKCKKVKRDEDIDEDDVEMSIQKDNYYFSTALQMIYPGRYKEKGVVIKMLKQSYVPHDETYMISKEPIRILCTSNLKRSNDGRMLVPKTLYNSFLESFDEYRDYLHSHSVACGADILDMILNGRVKSVQFCEPNWPSDGLMSEWGYLIDCTTKELLVYCPDEGKSECLGNDPLEFINPIKLIARFDINNLPSDEELKKLES